MVGSGTRHYDGGRIIKARSLSIGLIMTGSKCWRFNTRARVGGRVTDRHHGQDPVRSYKARMLAIHLRGGIRSEWRIPLHNAFPITITVIIGSLVPYSLVRFDYHPTEKATEETLRSVMCWQMRAAPAFLSL